MAPDVPARQSRVAERLADWLAPRLGDALAAHEVDWRRPWGAGWSNDTLVVYVRGAPAVVLRMQPDGPAMFPTYDLGREARLLAELDRQGSVPLARLLGEDLAGEVFGRPMLASAFVAGRVPADDRPSFAEAGFLYEADADVQRRFHCNLIDALAVLHAMPVCPFADALAMPIPSSLEATLDALQRVWLWDRGVRWPTFIDTAFALLRERAPAVVRACFLWGDARPANVIVGDDGCTLRALLDWELAELGPPQLDLAWLLEMNRMRTVGAGVAPLPGFLDDEASAAHYAARSGQSLTDMAWYRAFSALKMAVLMHRYLRAAVQRGELPAEHRVLGDTVASRRVAQLLELAS